MSKTAQRLLLWENILSARAWKMLVLLSLVGQARRASPLQGRFFTANEDKYILKRLLIFSALILIVT